ncbi:MAG: M48 family metalloprotease [Phycisphaerae bacterium]
MSNEAIDKKAKDYQQKQLRLGLIEEISTIFFLIVWVRISHLVIAHFSNRNRYSLLILFAALIYGSYQVALFVLDYLSDYRLEHKYELSTESFLKWLWRHTKTITLAGLLLGVLIVLLYTAVWHLNYWYIWCWAGWVLLSVLLAQIFPIIILPIFYHSKRLENESLLNRFRRLAEGTGLNVEGVYSLELSESTKKANAMLTGLGRTRRVLLGDTLLSRLNEDQLEVVYAHELGHHVFRHFHKMLFLHALSSIVFFALIYLILNPYAGATWNYVQAIEKIPLVALVVSLFTFFWKPILYAFSRHFEIQCDRYALSRTGSPENFVAAFEILAEQNLADPDPPRWVVWLYYDHPPIHERIAMAKQ